MVFRFRVIEHICEKKIWKNKRETGQIALQKMILKYSSWNDFKIQG